MIPNLKINPSNPRIIKKKQYERLLKSLESFTKMLELRPIVYDENGIILGGNMRYQALTQLASDKKIELKDSYFKQVIGYTEAEKKEFVIRDNVELGDWDMDSLANEWSDLPLEEWGIDLSGWGTEVEEDDAPEVSKEEPVSKLGEVYQLGRHRLMCGDSTKIEDVEKLMNGQKADMVFTDPPYNISQEDNGLRSLDYGNWDKGFDMNSIYPTITEFNKGSIYIFCGWEQLSGILSFLVDAKYLVRPIFWHKPNPNVINGDKNWLPSVEVCAYGKVSSGTFNGGIKHNLIESSIDGDRNHPTQKPIKVVSECVSTSSNNDETVLDLFGGSGSTLIACEQLDRTCYMMEIDPKYCDVIRKRYAKFIGEEDWQEI